jgi:hypothetical protein
MVLKPGVAKIWVCLKLVDPRDAKKMDGLALEMTNHMDPYGL